MSGEIVQDRTTGAWWWRCPRCGKQRTHRERDWVREVALVHDTVCGRDREQTTTTSDGEGTPSLLDILKETS